MKPLVYRKAKRLRHQPPVRHTLQITKGDTVQVISGDDKGKRGKVKRVDPKTGRVEVEGINVITKHQKPTQAAPGGKIRREAPVHHSKLMLIDPKTGEPTRIRRQKDADGTLERIAVKSGQSIPRSR
jgi:large subunit ribosomal protein L24